MFCVKCGTGLEQGKCPTCGFVDDTYNGDLDTTTSSAVVKDQPERKSKANKKEKVVKEKKVKEKKIKEKRPKEKKVKEKTDKQKSTIFSKLKLLFSKDRARERRTLTKKRKQAIVIIAVATAIVLGVVAFTTVYLIKDTRYKAAINYLEKNRPEVAKNDFEELKSFKESELYLADCNTLISYYDAVDDYEDEDYEGALTTFKELGLYRDSENYSLLCQDYIDYNGAKAFFKDGNYEQAKAVFVVLGDFEDSIDMANSCQDNMDYNEAQTLFAVEEYEGAMRLFVSIPEFKDSKDMAFVCEWLIVYEEAFDAHTKGNYKSAVNLFEEVYNTVLTSRVDFKGKVNFKELKFYQGQCYYNQELFYSAYINFKYSEGFTDAASMAEKCKQPIETDELYINPDYTKNSIKMTFYAPEKGEDDICIEVYSEKNNELVSICYVKNNDKLRVYFPAGTYYYKICYGNDWFGLNEGFGKEFHRVTFEDGANTQKLNYDYYYWINF